MNGKNVERHERKYESEVVIGRFERLIHLCDRPTNRAMDGENLLLKCEDAHKVKTLDLMETHQHR